MDGGALGRCGCRPPARQYPQAPPRLAARLRSAPTGSGCLLFFFTSAREPPPLEARFGGFHVVVADLHETALRAAMRSGAAGVISPDVTVEEARAILSAVAAGYFPIRQHLAAGLATRLEPATPNELTERDRTILDRLARGDTIRAIAQRLGCSQRHTRRHLRTLWDKMGVSGRAEGLVAAARRGLISL